MIVFIGSNPSRRSSVRDAAFDLSTRSGRILASWIKDVRDPIVFLNVSDAITDNTRPLTVAEIKTALPNLRIKLQDLQATRTVALGKTAARALTLLGCNFYEMPHPSGMNRRLNCKTYVSNMLNGLYAYLGM